MYICTYSNLPRLADDYITHYVMSSTHKSQPPQFPAVCESRALDAAMSRHRMKTVSYDEADDDDDVGYYDDEGGESLGADEQAVLEQCTNEVLDRLLSEEPYATPTRDEVQEALWHYYNDVDKSVNYLRSMCVCRERGAVGFFLCFGSFSPALAKTHGRLDKKAKEAQKLKAKTKPPSIAAASKSGLSTGMMTLLLLQFVCCCCCCCCFSSQRCCLCSFTVCLDCGKVYGWAGRLVGFGFTF